MESLSEMSTRTVAGRTLVPMGKIAGRMTYTLTSRGETWRFIPDIRSTYLLRRIADGLQQDCATLEAAVAYVNAFEQRTDER